METKKFVAYYRVSTKIQDLGLTAQQMQVESYIKKSGGVLVHEYQEKESGKKDNRPELEKAIQMCKEIKATLIVAKLDRLSRHAKFLFELHDAKLDIVVCDLPELNTLTFGIFATLAQHERELISERTKAALKAKKEREGEKCLGYYANGNTTFTDADRRKALEARKSNMKVNKNTKQASDKLMLLLIQHPDYTLQAFADELNKSGYTTARGGQFTPTQVSRIKNTITNQ